jgi:hypothetical protein
MCSIVIVPAGTQPGATGTVDGRAEGPGGIDGLTTGARLGSSDGLPLGEGSASDGDGLDTGGSTVPSPQAATARTKQTARPIRDRRRE